MDVEDHMEESVSALLELSKLRASLSQKLRELQSDVATRQKLQEEPTSALTEEELISQIKAAEEELRSARNANVKRDKIVKMLFYGQEAFKAVYSNHSEDEMTTMIHQEISSKLEALSEINKNVLEKVKTLTTLDERLEEAKKRLQDIEWKNRDLCVLLKNAEDASEITMRRKKAEDESKKTKDLKEGFENSVKELKLRKETFQALIHASKIDWFSDKELCQLVISLGDPIKLNQT